MRKLPSSWPVLVVHVGMEPRCIRPEGGDPNQKLTLLSYDSEKLPHVRRWLLGGVPQHDLAHPSLT
jgi:hypothetical protein